MSGYSGSFSSTKMNAGESCTADNGCVYRIIVMVAIYFGVLIVLFVVFALKSEASRVCNWVRLGCPLSLVTSQVRRHNLIY